MHTSTEPVAPINVKSSNARSNIRFLDTFLFRHHEDLTDQEKNGLFLIYSDLLEEGYPTDEQGGFTEVASRP